ncbi:RidA family protein [Dactylosporangium fulvum]|uniref:RidA family protein n=1 Tax=Dactylosporangium fulvum TaxID=53359 RepID=A0ABY5WC65_9ACTN|nr:RidA family protein [Dactylosporangium fulvum]UWP86794.1 RidA family protein [Dactylosporangium fulvum]
MGNKETQAPTRRVVNLTGIPQPLAHKSMAVVSGNTIYVSGQLGKGDDGKPLPTLREQGYQAMRQLEAILKAAGSDLNHILRMGIYVTDINGLMTISDIKKELIPNDPPASFGYEVSALALGALVEIDAIAVVAEGV